jgi:putative nucleotidyltransferase with HDIG domain
MKRILFVDDERRIVDGLQRMLHSHRKKWEMTFVNSGEEALAVLARSAYDVIVSDMRMPGMDGTRLLQLVSERYPGTMRIVLSGQFDKEAAMRAVPVAHQFLTKPCDVNTLLEVIERSSGEDSAVPDAAIRRIIATVGHLPPLPHTAAALIAAVDDHAATLDQVSAIVERDVAVAAKVLQLVNSAFFGLSHEIATVPVAVGFLGFDVLKQLVVTVELFRSFECACHIAGFSVEETQRHSRCVAAIAARLPVPRKQAAATSVAALLHDVGKLVLAARLPEHLERALRASSDQKLPLHIVEEELLGITHAEIGAHLLSLWGLPAPVISAVAQHHHRVRATADGAIDIRLILHIADLLDHEASGTSESDRHGALDEVCVDSREYSDSLPAWRKIADEVVQREAQCR